MEILLLITTLLLTISSLFLIRWSIINNRSSNLFTRWPFLEMLPAIFSHLFHDLQDFVATLLIQSGFTFEFKGPWFTGMDFFLTSDPVNVNYILNKNFLNYNKGPDYRDIFDHHGDGILTANSDSWKYQRRIVHSFINNVEYESFVMKNTTKKVFHGLFPLLEHLFAQNTSKNEVDIDLQDLFNRLSFDISCSSVLGFDPKALSVDFPKLDSQSAFKHLEEVVFYRHVIPIKLMRLQRWFQIGWERNIRRDLSIADRLIHDCISSRTNEKSRGSDEKHDLLTAFVANKSMCKPDPFLRDMLFNLIMGGNETVSSALSWFFWLVAKNPSVRKNILDEIDSQLPKEFVTSNMNDPLWYANLDDDILKKSLSGMVYLHASFCESLRLYPPVSVNHRTVIEDDTLPSGHRVKRGARILMSYYTMGRMKELWGDDCLEFKPERWLSSSKQDIVHVSSQKFITFNLGPRSCLGKNITLIEVKIVASIILRNYFVRLVDDRENCPSSSMIIHMHNGLKVKLSKRNI